MVNYNEGIKESVKKAVLGEEGILSPENLNQVSNLVGKSVGNFVHDQQDKLVNLKDQYKNTIKDYPLSSIATAFAAGIIMGLLIRRS